MTIFLATDLTAGEATPMDDERIETRWFKRKELAEMIRRRQDRRRQDDGRLLRLAGVEGEVKGEGLARPYKAVSPRSSLRMRMASATS